MRPSGPQWAEATNHSDTATPAFRDTKAQRLGGVPRIYLFNQGVPGLLAYTAWCRRLSSSRQGLSYCNDLTYHNMQ